MESEEIINAYGQKREVSETSENMARIGISNVSVGTLDGPILMGRVHSRRLD